uniref:Uncharacterized protein n=1 Tax=Faecalibaculum rodentium TaxID=1702221 RepID=A0A140DU65_9FIRM|nr:hypothetical protein AALO17_10580 [Faecalibaculum rodentium]
MRKDRKRKTYRVWFSESDLKTGFQQSPVAAFFRSFNICGVR